MTNQNEKKGLPGEITWKAESHTQHTRSPIWYIGFGVISLGLIIFGLYTRSILTIITFIVVIFTVLLVTSQKPKTVNYRASKTGFTVGETLYPYKIIRTFWINYTTETRTLNLETTAYLNNTIVIQLGNQDPITLKLYLSQYLKENLDREESLTETLARRLKI